MSGWPPSPQGPLHGFLVSDGNITGITSSGYTAVKLGGNADRDLQARAFRDGVYFGDLELVADETATTVAQIDGFLSWDVAGDNICAGLFSLTSTEWVRGQTDTSLIMGTVELRAPRTAPAGWLNYIYLWLKTDAGTISVAGNCRLGWSIYGS